MTHKVHNAPQRRSKFSSKAPTEAETRRLCRIIEACWHGQGYPMASTWPVKRGQGSAVGWAIDSCIGGYGYPPR